MKYFISILVVVLSTGSALASQVYGLERMERFDLLPYLLKGTQVRQVSSYDRSGGNDDGFNGTYSSLYVDENGEYVLFDEVGAGCLYRFWMTYGTTPADYADYRLRFYFDNETVPRLDLSIADFFDGAGEPLEFPLVGSFNKSSHGCYCYLPFPYRKRLKVTLSGKPLFYQMTYHRLASAEGIVSWIGNEDTAMVLDQWNNVGTDPKLTVSNLTVSGSVSVAPGGASVLFNSEGAGVIQSIKIDPSPATESILTNVWIEMNWDAGTSEVSVPLGDFFGSGKGQVNVASLPIGMKTSGFWYCFFPMPYWESAEIRLINKGDSALATSPFEIQYSTNAYRRADVGCFHALFREESVTNNGCDICFIDEKGRGQIVGLSLLMESSGAGGYMDMNYLEGDERVYVDGSRSPCIYGTGTEDYFNSGWYFNKGTFNLPYHGHPWRDQFHDDEPNYTQAFRFHISDTIPFNQSVKFGMEHGDGNASPGTYSSVVYYYKQGSASGLELVANLDIGDVWTETVYNYHPSAECVSVSNTWFYEGDDDDLWINDIGYSGIDVECAYTVPIPEDCDGLIIRRRSDQGVGGQRAQVFVDDVLVGVWYDADHNFSSMDQRWLDSEFLIPPSFLTGKSLVNIRVQSSGSGTWTEYRYTVFAVTPSEDLVDSDGDCLPDHWELECAGGLNVFSADHHDEDIDGYTDYDEYIAGTDPCRLRSVPEMSPLVTTIPSVEISTAIGRVYSLQQCGNLFSNNWETMLDDIPGNGAVLSLPMLFDADMSYYRFLVEKP